MSRLLISDHRLLLPPLMQTRRSRGGSFGPTPLRPCGPFEQATPAGPAGPPDHYRRLVPLDLCCPLTGRSHYDIALCPNGASVTFDARFAKNGYHNNKRAGPLAYDENWCQVLRDWSGRFRNVVM